MPCALRGGNLATEVQQTVRHRTVFDAPIRHTAMLITVSRATWQS
jgi:hypothetical protein